VLEETARPDLNGLRPLSRRLGPASRLVPFLAARILRHARPRAVQGGADARLRLDEEGRKMSKSLGNVVAPQEVMSKYGADILRLWVGQSAPTIPRTMRIGKEILKQQTRCTAACATRCAICWAISDGSVKARARCPDYAKLPELERWVLHRMAELNEAVKLRRTSATMTSTPLFTALHNFCNTSTCRPSISTSARIALYCDP
jgi:isoleucyl-tRNA synthetase